MELQRSLCYDPRVGVGGEMSAFAWMGVYVVVGYFAVVGLHMLTHYVTPETPMTAEVNVVALVLYPIIYLLLLTLVVIAGISLPIEWATRRAVRWFNQ